MPLFLIKSGNSRSPPHRSTLHFHRWAGFLKCWVSSNSHWWWQKMQITRCSWKANLQFRDLTWNFFFFKRNNLELILLAFFTARNEEQRGVWRSLKIWNAKLFVPLSLRSGSYCYLISFTTLHKVFLPLAHPSILDSHQQHGIWSCL